MRWSDLEKVDRMTEKIFASAPWVNGLIFGYDMERAP
jgi:hypothetical protein